MSYLTAELAGTGGSIKEDVEDFVVEEIALYEPTGEGEHLYLWIEKRRRTTFDLVRALAGAFGVRERNIGYAGLKDARAITRQWVSIPGASEADARALDLEGVDVLDARRHRNKLKLGHLRGNRFSIVVRGTKHPERAGPILEELARTGLPNRFGPQRFGSRGTSHHLGAALLRADHRGFLDALLGGPEGFDTSPGLAEARRRYLAGDAAAALEVMPTKLRAERKALHALVRFDSEERAVHAVPASMRRLYVSALQSWMFNRILEARLDGLGTLEEGDLAYLHRNGGVFLVEDAAAEQPRCDAFEISPSGPLVGTKSLLASGAPGERERAVLRDAGFEKSDFRAATVRLEGARRSLRVPLRDVAWEALEDAVRVEFALPRGSFATVVLDEVMKTNDAPAIPPLPPAPEPS